MCIDVVWFDPILVIVPVTMKYGVVSASFSSSSSLHCVDVVVDNESLHLCCG